MDEKDLDIDVFDQATSSLHRQVFLDCAEHSDSVMEMFEHTLCLQKRRK